MPETRSQREVSGAPLVASPLHTRRGGRRPRGARTSVPAPPRVRGRPFAVGNTFYKRRRTSASKVGTDLDAERRAATKLLRTHQVALITP